MDRRAFVASLAAALPGLAGCSNPFGFRAPPPAIADQPCPPHESDADGVVCSHTVDRGTAPVFLAASPETSAVSDGRPVDEVTLTLSNRTDQPLRFNPGNWELWRHSGERWEELPPEQVGDGVVELPPGGTRRWTLLEAAGLIRHEPSFEPGLYAAGLGVGAVTDPDTYERDTVTALALVRLVRAG